MHVSIYSLNVSLCIIMLDSQFRLGELIYSQQANVCTMRVINPGTKLVLCH
jgi:hypothetical protein